MALDQYYKQAEQAFSPFQQQAEAAMRARLADQGLLSSTGGQGAVQRTGDEWRGRKIDWATQQGNNMRDFAERQRQYNADFAWRARSNNAAILEARRKWATEQGMRAWELAQSAELGRAGFSEDYKMRNVQDPMSWRDLWNQRFMGDPLEQREAPTGDPREQDMYGPRAIPRSAPLNLKPNTVYQREWQTEQNAAELALRERLAADEMALAREKFEYEKGITDKELEAKYGSDDPWDAAYELAMANITEGRPITADELVAAARMKGIDLRSELTGRYQNPRALAFLKLAAGEEWREKFAEITGQRIDGAMPITRPGQVNTADTMMGTSKPTGGFSRFGNWLADLFSITPVGQPEQEQPSYNWNDPEARTRAMETAMRRYNR